MIEYVYFMGKPDGTAPIKIGKTQELASRLTTVRIYCPFPIDCHGYAETEDASSLEIAIHSHFKDRRLHREWFDVSADEARSVFESLDVLDKAANVVLPNRNDKIGRPRTGYNKAEYNRQYMADLRKAKPLGLKVSEYRKSKET